MATMKAMVLRKTDQIENFPLGLEERPIPSPGPKEVLVQLKSIAICRTDLHVIENDLPVQKLPLIPGHQGVGRIVQCGSGCTRFHLGDRVGIAWLRKTCGLCEFCQRGQENLCLTPSFTGYHEDGVYAEFAVIHEDFCYSIPKNFEDIEAVPLLCAGIIGFRSLKRSELPEKGHLGIFGFGSSAHIIMQIARSRGARVSVVTIGEVHQKLARELGAEWVSSTTEGLKDLMDSVIIFAPAGNLVPNALEVLKPGGTLAIAGIHMSDIPILNYEKHLFHEKNLRSVTANTRKDGEELLAEAARIPVRPRIQIYTFSQLNQALLDLKQDRISGTGVIQL